MRSSATPLKLSGQSVTAPDLIHIVVPTECNEYQSWQVSDQVLARKAFQASQVDAVAHAHDCSLPAAAGMLTASLVAQCHSLLPLSDQVLGLYWSWRQVGSPGMFTRIACCNIETLEVCVLS